MERFEVGEAIASRSDAQPRSRLPFAWTSVALAFVALVASEQALAVDIDIGSPDWASTWNNSIRYNWARRMQSRDDHVALAGPAGSYDQGDYLFDKGDTIANRLDLLSELNLAYKGRYGLRVSAAAWFDSAYGSTGKSAPGLAPSYLDNQFTPVVKRYYRGPSGEFLDSYVFGNFALNDVDVNVRAGRHAVVWGEGLFGSTHSIAYSQAPSDSRKSVSSPGASAKETALPINQVSSTAVVGSDITLLAQYQFEWKANRYPEGGTYFGPTDVIMDGPNVGRASTEDGSKGAFGLGLKYSPDWLDGTVGLYYRKFDDTGGWVTQFVSLTPVTTTKAVFAKGIELYGLSLSKNIAGISVGADLSYRRNGPLTSSTTATAGPTQRYEGAVGNTWHAVLNGIVTYGASSFFNSAALSGEIAWAKLDRITRNENLFRDADHVAACNGAANPQNIRGCVDGAFRSVSVQFSPTWQQVYPGVDLSAPVFFSKNFGNSPSNAGGSNGFATYKVGLSASAYARHQLDLSYTWFTQKIDRDTPLTNGAYGRLLGAPYSDKGFLSLTYQTTF
jgi:Protein of unknown function (DUF1302)